MPFANSYLTYLMAGFGNEAVAKLSYYVPLLISTGGNSAT